ncbi:type II toxin-antitoxin system VapC family toxin [candidate division KSB1 bacterium]|nr:type II toxin-antitoxin system VapC family toxin [candidate division KSB1 bacterium]NIR70949.1 type II toxin-antitoxin system VapC family toxin [candidate division KSB1 bacterium]NIT70134.1 type II toxin-antitoxin system VapC family toxin [candidate division KSB1 bacterium]NIU23788.1 type II toxin-antitoxin system VapC family toxin [candidate division KSB1 bacterium]NIV94548.1 PIN domain-containing protein [candidate division KSB1 bacterium]
MAMVLRLEKRKLSHKAKAIFEEAEKGNATLFVPAMALAEIGYLSERNKIDTNPQEVKDYCQRYPTVHVEAITEEIIHKSFEIDDIPELHDRIIAGTAHLKNLKLITNDQMIMDSKYNIYHLVRTA